jgi:peptidoglycan/LPS O-acetylase OafA/YrhL
MLVFAYRATRFVPVLFQSVIRWWRTADGTGRARSRAIDVLRAAAILLVLGCHYVVHPDQSGLFAPVAASWYRVGWAGVDLFFVLSGFLVSGLLFAEYRRTGGLDVRRFLVRRSLKIWPAYFAYLAFLALWFTWQRSQGKPVAVFDSLGANLLHLQNYLGTPREHTWSLAVEEHFYLGLALLGFAVVQSHALLRLLRRWFPLVAAGALLGLAALRYAEFATVGREGMNLYATHLRFDGLLAGTLLAYLHHFRPAALAWAARRPLLTVGAGTLVALPGLIATPDLNAWAASVGLSGMYLGFALVVIGCVHLERTARGARLFASRPAGALAAIGFYSYGIYLWHIDLVQTPLRKIAALVQPAWLPETLWWGGMALTYVAAAFAAGAVLSRLIEQPTLALREKYFGDRPRQPVAVPTPLPAPAAAAV